MQTLADYLHPRRFPNCSEQMFFIIGTIIGEPWVSHELAGENEQFVVTADRMVVTTGLFFGPYDEFERNVRGYVDAAELPIELERRFWELYGERVDLTWAPFGMVDGGPG